MSTLITAPKPHKLRRHGVIKSIQPSTSAIADTRRGRNRTWLLYPEDESEYSVGKVPKEGDKSGACTGGWCGRKRRGRVSACRWVDWRGGSGLDEVGWQLSRM